MTEGDCMICGGHFAKRGITRHLAGCLTTVPPAPDSKPRAAFHLLVEGGYRKEYWLHLLAAADATLADVDGLLRDL